MAMTITSSVFRAGEVIPSKYSCEGANVSPPVQWDGVPAGARSLVLICDDPDAPMGTWVHWVLYNLPTSVSNLPEHVPASEMLSSGAKPTKPKKSEQNKEKFCMKCRNKKSPLGIRFSNR
jgi:Raf kinase inhibitor-like YbhB/YbcL family protein